MKAQALALTRSKIIKQKNPRISSRSTYNAMSHNSLILEQQQQQLQQLQQLTPQEGVFLPPPPSGVARNDGGGGMWGANILNLPYKINLMSGLI